MNPHALAEQFTAAEFTPKQSDALIYAFQSRHEKLVTREHFDRELGLNREYLALIRERMDALTEHMKREHALTRERMDSPAERMNSLAEHMDSSIKRLEDNLIAAMRRDYVILMVTVLSGFSLILAAIGIAAALLPMGSP